MVSLLTGVLFGVAPAFSALRLRISESLKEGNRSGVGRSRGYLRQALIVAEFALSLVLLTGAGLMIATFTRLLHSDFGFNPHPILSLQFWLYRLEVQLQRRYHPFLSGG